MVKHSTGFAPHQRLKDIRYQIRQRKLILVICEEKRTLGPGEHNLLKVRVDLKGVPKNS